MLYFHRMKKNDIENRTQKDVFLWAKPVVVSVIISLMETVVVAVGTLVLLVLAWR